eukprot:scaffold186976_cov36-Prasinocladus_malaysianus.AAC.1
MSSSDEVKEMDSFELNQCCGERYEAGPAAARHISRPETERRILFPWLAEDMTSRNNNFPFWIR